MSINIVRNGTLSAVDALPSTGAVGEILTVINLGTATANLNDGDYPVQIKGGSIALATNDSIQFVWNGTDWVELSRSRALESYRLSVSGSEEVSGDIEVGVQVLDLNGNNVAGVKNIKVRTLAVTADKGDITAGAAGTLVKAVNPATGENVAWIQTSSTGAASFIVNDDVAEAVSVEVSCDNALVSVSSLTFAGP